jgi:hypothetical protein
MREHPRPSRTAGVLKITVFAREEARPARYRPLGQGAVFGYSSSNFAARAGERELVFSRADAVRGKKGRPARPWAVT